MLTPDLEDARAPDPFVYLLADFVLDQAQVPRAAHVHLVRLKHHLQGQFAGFGQRDKAAHPTVNVDKEVHLGTPQRLTTDRSNRGSSVY